VESLAYFCAASETAWDVAAHYAEAKIGTLPDHNFIQYAMGSTNLTVLLGQTADGPLRYFLEVYMDDYIHAAIAASPDQLRHIAMLS
jgi:hypothetical protein